MNNDEARAQLAAFVEGNPLSSIENKDDRIVVKDPWGDETLILRLPEVPDEMIGMLNRLTFPPMFSALYHRETRDLEFIYSPRETKERGRRFEFLFNGKGTTCEFLDTSPELRKVASIARPIAPPSHTKHRNLATFNSMRRLGQDPALTGTSFWVRDIELDPDAILELARNLNFFMWYFDRKTPRIEIHEPRAKKGADKTPQYRFDEFPTKISGRPLETFLLQLWEGFIWGNIMSRVLYGYQIIEFVAFYHLQESIQQTIRRVLTSPEILARPVQASRQILEIVAEDRLEDAVKVEKVIDVYVDHEMLAAAIKRNLPCFSAEVQFDGGFNLPSVCSSKWDPKDAKDYKELSQGSPLL